MPKIMKTNNFILDNYIGILLCSMLVFFSCAKKDALVKQNLEKAALVSPTSQAQDVGIENVNLERQSANSLNGGPVVYDIYLDGNNPLTTKIKGDVNSTIYRMTTKLEYGTTYYWRIIAKDGKGGENESNVGVFSIYEQTNKDLLIGKWFLREVTDQDTPVPLRDCLKKDDLQFSVDGSVNIENYRGTPCTMYSSGSCERRVFHSFIDPIRT